jgi:hypothetical protein
LNFSDVSIKQSNGCYWQSDSKTLNEMPGYFAAKFRPHRTLHTELPGFDYHMVSKMLSKNSKPGEEAAEESSNKRTLVGPR